MTVSEEGCKNGRGEFVLKFSKKFIAKLEEIRRNGFELKKAIVNFIVFWKDEEKNLEVKIILPELQFEKGTTYNL